MTITFPDVAFWLALMLVVDVELLFAVWLPKMPPN
jgi:hypothetical protein